MKRIAVIVLIIALLAGGLWHLHSTTAAEQAGGKMKGPQNVVTAPLARRDLAVTIEAVGSLLAGEAADIHAEVAGQIKSISFEEGQPVKKGDLLINIDTSLIETDLLKAKAARDAARASFNRDDQLKSKGFVADQQYDSSRAALQAAEAEVANAEILLQKASIVAPFDGIAGLRNFSVGDYAAAGQTLTSIVSLHPLKMSFTVPERDFAAVKAGQEISFTVDAWPGQDFKGEIYAIDPRINAENRNFAVRATIPNEDGRLRPGMYARIRITTATRPGALMAPEEAVVPQGTESYVFTAEGGKAARRKVELGERREGEVEIKSGLDDNARVITAGVMKLRDGSEIVEAAPAEAAAEPAAGGDAADGGSKK